MKTMPDKNGSKDDVFGENAQDLTYSLTYKDVVDILEIIDSMPGWELRLELGDLRMTVVKRGSAG